MHIRYEGEEDLKQDDTNQIEAEAEDLQAEADVSNTDVTDDEAMTTLDPESAEAKLLAAEAKVAEYLDGWQRSRAELENYKKRVLRDKENWRAEILGEVFNKVLLAFDDFDLAMQNLPEKLEQEDWVTGIHKVHKKFQQQLEQLDIAEVPGEGEAFDPTIHEAVMRAQSEDYEAGTIIEVLRKGYAVDGRVIRPALVKVAE